MDTAPNYQSGQAENSLATALAMYPALHVSTTTRGDNLDLEEPLRRRLGYLLGQVP
ncbi:hypothetical protein [Kitasatospora purpeofusca]|uniref:hypothetical protein n=1 Tax=Kitasatospora purpeofusca TaxID=67352 RepID=UPI003665880C